MAFPAVRPCREAQLVHALGGAYAFAGHVADAEIEPVAGNDERGIPVAADRRVRRSIGRREAVPMHTRERARQKSVLEGKRVLVRLLQLLRTVEGVAEL